MKTLMLFLLLSGCASTTPRTFEKLPGQEAAEQLVWHGIFRETEPAPPVEWREPECVDDLHQPGVWSYNIRGAEASCRAGFYWLGGGVVVMKSEGLHTNWFNLFHEWTHAKAWLDFDGDADVLHQRADWSLEFAGLAMMVQQENELPRQVLDDTHQGTPCCTN